MCRLQSAVLSYTLLIKTAVVVRNRNLLKLLKQKGKATSWGQRAETPVQEAWPWQSLEPGAAKLSGIRATFLFHMHAPCGLGRAFKRTSPAPKQKVGLDGVFPSCASCRILDSINWVSKLYSFTIHGGEDPRNSTYKSQAAVSTLVHSDDSSLCGSPQGCHVELPTPPPHHQFSSH